MLGPPLAWTGAFLTTYGFARFACLFDFAAASVAGMSLVRFVSFAVVGVAAAVAGYAGWVSFRWWGELAGDPDASPTGAERFASLLGMVLAGLFGSGLLFLALVVPFSPPCLP